MNIINTMPIRYLACLFLILSTVSIKLCADSIFPISTEGLSRQAPAENPPFIESSEPHQLLPFEFDADESPNQYSFGNPSDNETLYVELINRARLDTNAETQRLSSTNDPNILNAYSSFNVNLNLFSTQMSTLADGLPPLAINKILTDTARLHSQDQFDNIFQGHFSSSNPPAPFQSNGGTGDRATAMGFSWSSIRENVFSYSEHTLYGHAGFVVDWGYDAGGMQNPPGHREAIYTASESEIGIGIIEGTNSDGFDSVGPQIVTQIFANSFATTSYLTGVVYYDLDNDNFYDLGEGLGEIKVEVSDQTDFAISAASGAYVLPVNGIGSHTVTFLFPEDIALATAAFTIDTENVKQDLALSYIAPGMMGSNTPDVGKSNTYQITPIIAATSYKIEIISLREQADFIEGAESGASAISIQQSSGYDFIQSDVTSEGNYSFHFAHPGGASSEILEIDQDFIVGASSSVSFDRRLGWAASDQQARVEISNNNGLSWQILYSQNGTGDSGEAGFTTQAISLSSYQDQNIRIRFVYQFVSGSFFNQTWSGVGWYVDNIVISNIREVGEKQLIDNGLNTEFVFSPEKAQQYWLRAQPLNGQRVFPFGNYLVVNGRNNIENGLGIRAVIESEEKGEIEAVWSKGGEAQTARGDKVIWGHFYANPADVSWGSLGNPDLFVKIWFDISGRIDVNYFHVSVPRIKVSTWRVGQLAEPDQVGTTDMQRRYIRHYFNTDGSSGSDVTFEDGISPENYTLSPNPAGFSMPHSVNIGTQINTVEVGLLQGDWQLGGQALTVRGDEVVWGYFSANPGSVTWGNSNNPEIFVKIWYDVSGRIDVNYFHVSVPDIGVYSSHQNDVGYDQSGVTILQDRYTRHEFFR